MTEDGSKRWQPQVLDTYSMGASTYRSVFRIRIHMFLGLPDPDPLVRGMEPSPDFSIILLSSSKNSEKNFDSYYFVTSFDFLSLKNDVKVYM